MHYAATLRKPGCPPTKIGPFQAPTDGAARRYARQVAKGAMADVSMLWETKDGRARQVAL